MRKTVLSALILSLTFALAATAAAPGVADTVALQPDVDGLVPLTEQPQACTDDPAVDEIERLFQPVVFHCPFGAPHCRRDNDCDAYCGDPRFGHCFSDGCCGCSG